jgi:mono/diheme cytochrome c family protein
MRSSHAQLQSVPCRRRGELRARPRQQAGAGLSHQIQVRNGLGAMPAFPEDEISPHELDDIVASMKARRPLPPNASHVKEKP